MSEVHLNSWEFVGFISTSFNQRLQEPLTLFGRSNLLEEQLKIGSVGVDQGCASSLTTQVGRFASEQHRFQVDSLGWLEKFGSHFPNLLG